VTPAIQKAAESAKKKLIQLAIKDKKSPFFEMKIDDLSYQNGEIVGGGKSADFGAHSVESGEVRWKRWKWPLRARKKRNTPSIRSAPNSVS
jgi:hypothetical protein